MFRLVNINKRAAFEYDGSWYDLAELSGDAMLAEPNVESGAAASLPELLPEAVPIRVLMRKHPRFMLTSGAISNICSVSEGGT
jgi:hypothetical protein